MSEGYQKKKLNLMICTFCMMHYESLLLIFNNMKIIIYLFLKVEILLYICENVYVCIFLKYYLFMHIMFLLLDSIAREVQSQRDVTLVLKLHLYQIFR